MGRRRQIKGQWEWEHTIKKRQHPLSGAISCQSFGIMSASHLQNTDNKIGLYARKQDEFRIVEFTMKSLEATSNEDRSLDTANKI